MNGSPVNLASQLHIGLWFITWHLAFSPQVPGQGSAHFWFIQARFWGHSLLILHSGWQFGGFPEYSGRQEQTAWLLISLHWLLGPQGLGWQGFVGSGITSWNNIRLGKKQVLRTTSLTLNYYTTILEWITSITGNTSAYREMISDLAVRILTACSWAWILAFVADTSFVRGTISVDRTFWSTTFVRISYVIG